MPSSVPLIIKLEHCRCRSTAKSQDILTPTTFDDVPASLCGDRLDFVFIYSFLSYSLVGEIIISLFRTPGEENHIRAGSTHTHAIRISGRMVREETRWQELNQDTLRLRERIPGEAHHTENRFK